MNYKCPGNSAFELMLCDVMKLLCIQFYFFKLVLQGLHLLSPMKGVNLELHGIGLDKINIGLV